MIDRDFELLLVKDIGNSYELIGVTYSTALHVDPSLTTLKATMLTIQKAKQYLKEGINIIIPKVTKFSEVQLDELIISNEDEISKLKRCVINEINARMHQSIIGVSLIDAMTYMNNYLKLLNMGYCITDENREDKYFEIIEQSQSVEPPTPLDPENYTFEDEQRYIEEQKKYDTAQNTLSTLEKYLNAYDNLTKIQNICNILTESKEKIDSAQSKEEIEQIRCEYLSQIEKFNE
jgi:hypothetical protein